MTRDLVTLRQRFRKSLGATLLFSISARTAVAIVGLLVTPLYLKLLGPEAYGLVAFWAVAQSWMILFDLGISPAVARQLSRHRAGALNASDAASLLRVVEWVFLLSALVVGTAFTASIHWIGSHWLGSSKLPLATINSALFLTGALLVTRWMTGLYQAALVGLESQIPCNLVALLGVSLRSLGSVGALLLIAPTPAVFFTAQVAGALVEAGASRLLLAKVAPRGGAGSKVGARLLFAEVRFAAGLALGSSVATVINQSDKVVLSHMLPLRDFGRFSLVVSICAGIAMIVPPFVQTVQPRLTALLARDDRAGLMRLYRGAYAALVAFVGALAGTIAAQPQMVMFAWTGDSNLAIKLAPVLSLYAAGAGVSAFLYLPYLLQYAFGTVRLHVIGNLIFGAIWVPATVFAAINFGPIGTGVVWLTGNVAFLLLWMPLVHRRFLQADERRGLGWDGAKSFFLMAAALSSTLWVEGRHLDRIWSLVALMGITLGVCAVGVLSSRVLRAYLSAAIASRSSIRSALGAQAPSTDGWVGSDGSKKMAASRSE